MNGLARGRAGAGAGDVVLVLAILAVALALLYPTLRSRSVRAGFETAVAAVEAARTSAEAHLAQRGTWPAAAPSGSIPPELAAAFSADSTRTPPSYALRWATWEVIDHVPIALPRAATTDAPPDSVGPTTVPVVRQVGSILLHSGDDRLLAELLRRYAAEGAFVRDTTWTLVLPRRGLSAR